MNILALNTQLPNRLTKKVNFGLGFLPIVLMLAALVPVFMFSSWLSIVLDIQQGMPVKDQPNGGTWLIAFLAAFAAMVIAGYVLGWVLNAFGLRFLYGWSADKVSRLMFHSDVPSHWLLDDVAANTGNN